MQKAKVLIIHQNESVQRGIHNILAHFDIDFIFAFDGVDGLAAAKYDCPDLIISQVNLPVLNGIALSKFLKTECCTRDIPVIFLHDKLDYELLCEARGLEAEAFLLQPYINNGLIYTVKRAISLPIGIRKKAVSYEQSLSKRTPIYKMA